VPPDIYLEPSNVVLFELIWLSSQTTSTDYVMAWGAFPLVNGDFEINQGRFKLPLLNGVVDLSTNKFKDIEKKYIRNIDEWLANLYIEVRKFDVIGFQMVKEKIELKVPKDEVGLLRKRRRTLESKYRLIPSSQDSEDQENNEGIQDSAPLNDDDSDFDSAEDDEAPVMGEENRRNFDYHSYKYSVQ